MAKKVLSHGLRTAHAQKKPAGKTWLVHAQFGKVGLGLGRLNMQMRMPWSGPMNGGSDDGYIICSYTGL